MASNDLANIAAATAQKYSLTRTDRGAGSTADRFQTDLEKLVSGVPGAPAVRIFASGTGTSSAAADTAALADLNYIRSNRYGFDSGAVSADPKTITPNTAGGTDGPHAAATASSTRHTKDST